MLASDLNITNDERKALLSAIQRSCEDGRIEPTREQWALSPFAFMIFPEGLRVAAVAGETEWTRLWDSLDQEIFFAICVYSNLSTFKKSTPAEQPKQGTLRRSWAQTRETYNAG